jgi:mRNA interferase RelE/StbE
LTLVALCYILTLEIVYTKKALRDLRGITQVAAGLIAKKLRQYAGNPAHLVNQVTRLKGSGDLRLRVGDYRVIFTEDGVVLTVLKIGHRREIYD